MSIKKLKAFNQYVKEAQHATLSLELPDGEVININYPTGSVARQLRDDSDDTDSQVKALFGEDAGTKLLGYYDDAPATVLNEILSDVLKEFGLLGE